MRLMKKTLRGKALVTAALLALPCAAVHAQEPTPERSFLLDRLATYQEDSGAVSENAKAECGLERLIPQAAEKFASKYKVQIALSDGPSASTPASAARVSMQIAGLVAGRAGSGFGGQWVVSEVGIKVAVKQGDDILAKTGLTCKAGLGANPFANFRACDRLERCAEQLGAKTAKWLKGVASKADKANAAAAEDEAASTPEAAASE